MTRLFGHPFFEGANASEILKSNRKFVPEYTAINNIKKEIQDPNSKISTEGNLSHSIISLTNIKP